MERAAEKPDITLLNVADRFTLWNIVDKLEYPDAITLCNLSPTFQFICSGDYWRRRAQKRIPDITQQELNSFSQTDLTPEIRYITLESLRRCVPGSEKVRSVSDCLLDAWAKQGPVNYFFRRMTDMDWANLLTTGAESVKQRWSNLALPLRLQLIQKLVDAGQGNLLSQLLSTSSTGEDFYTAMLAAVRAGKADIVQLLTQQLPVPITPRLLQEVIQLTRDPALLDLIFTPDREPYFGYALLAAVRSGISDNVRYLLSKNNISQRNLFDALREAILTGHVLANDPLVARLQQASEMSWYKMLRSIYDDLNEAGPDRRASIMTGLSYLLSNQTLPEPIYQFLVKAMSPRTEYNV